MDFYEVLDQVIDLLRSRGGVTYRALQVQFQLDDDLLETLKGELLFSYPVVDQDGRGLMWTGDAAVPVPNTTDHTKIKGASRLYCLWLYCGYNATGG